MSQHTPGPWTCDPNGGYLIRGCHVKNIDTTWYPPVAYVVGPDGNTAYVANARLIAAAPEMHNLLKCYIGAHTLMTQALARYDEVARALLAEVEGVSL